MGTVWGGISRLHLGSGVKKELCDLRETRDLRRGRGGLHVPHLHILDEANKLPYKGESRAGHLSDASKVTS